MNEKLKPCPFCGGQAVLVDISYPYWVSCSMCNARINSKTEDRDGAIRAWNSRATIERDRNGMIHRLKIVKSVADAVADGHRKHGTR